MSNKKLGILTKKSSKLVKQLSSYVIFVIPWFSKVLWIAWRSHYTVLLHKIRPTSNEKLGILTKIFKIGQVVHYDHFFPNFWLLKKKNFFGLKSKPLRLWALFGSYFNPSVQETHLVSEAVSTNWASETWRVC